MQIETNITCAQASYIDIANVNISADKTSIGATGGTATISTSASRTRSYTWNGVAG